MLPGVYTQKSSSSTPFSYKKHLKTSHLGSIRKNHFKIPHILQKAGSQLKIFLHVPLREISISFRGQEWGSWRKIFFYVPRTTAPPILLPCYAPSDLLSAVPNWCYYPATHNWRCYPAIHNGCHYLQSPRSPHKNRTGHLHHIRCKRPGPYIS